MKGGGETISELFPLADLFPQNTKRVKCMQITSYQKIFYANKNI